MRFQILGPVSVADDSGQLKLDGPRLKALLAYLLLHANKPVSTSELLEALWGEEQPRSGVTAVQNSVLRLRRTIGDRIVTAGSGYLIRVEPGELDVDVFRDLIKRAARAAPAEKAALLRESLALWNGTALDGIDVAAFYSREAAALEDERLTALVTRVDAELDLGCNAELVPLLSTLAAENPLDERFRAQLIVALYRAGRQAAALDVYRETRRLLMDELGLEPSQSLRDLERAVLTQDPSLDYRPLPLPVVPIPEDGQAADELPQSEPASETRKLRRSFVAISSLGALAIAGVALGVTLTHEDSATPPGATTILRISEVAANQSTTSPFTKVTRKARVVHHVTSFPPDAPASPGTTAAQQPLTTAAPPQPVPAASPHTPTTTTTKAPAKTTPTHNAPATTGSHTTPTTPKTAAAPPAQVYWLADDFSVPGIDRDIWNPASHGTGVTAQEQNGRLELSVGSDVTSDGIYGFDQHYGTGCFLTGDFDATVDYQLLDWPVKDGMSVGFGLWRPPPSDFFWIYRAGAGADGGSESYAASGGGYAPTSDAAGKLRLRRKGPWLTMYYRHSDQWVTLSSIRAPGDAQLDLILLSNDSHFGYQPATVAFDNFDATADTVRCPGLPLPPRKANS